MTEVLRVVGSALWAAGSALLWVLSLPAKYPAAAGVWLALISGLIALQRFVLETSIRVTATASQEVRATTRLDLVFANPSRVANSILAVDCVTRSGTPLRLSHEQRDQLSLPFALPARSAVAKTLNINLPDGQLVGTVLVKHLEGTEHITTVPADFFEELREEVHVTDSADATNNQASGK